MIKSLSHKHFDMLIKQRLKEFKDFMEMFKSLKPANSIPVPNSKISLRELSDES